MSLSALGEPAREFVLTDGDFQKIADFISTQTGIQLPPQKKNLVYSRLSRRLRELGLDSFRAYLAYVETPEGGSEAVRMMNALTTNHTKFFREEHHFAHLAKTGLEAVRASGQKRLRLWSAGCSLGAEPYTIAMILQEALPNAAQWDIKILCTDIDTDVLAKAEAGVYPADTVKDIPGKYFQGPNAIEQDSKGNLVMPDLFRRWMHFKKLNFLHAWPMKKPFDLVFCRNVLIYFDRPTQDDIFQRFSQHLKPDGYLYIGHSETIRQLDNRWKNCGHTMYQRLGNS